MDGPMPQSFASSSAPASVGSFPTFCEPDLASCSLCSTRFTFFCRRHHCRKCGKCICNRCSPHRVVLGSIAPQRVCTPCTESMLVPGVGAAASAGRVPPIAAARSPQEVVSDPAAVAALCQRLQQEVEQLRQELQASTVEGAISRQTRRRATSGATGLHNFKIRPRPRGWSGDKLSEGDDCYFEVVDGHPYKDPTGFPSSLGPFKFKQLQEIKPEDLEISFDRSPVHSQGDSEEVSFDSSPSTRSQSQCRWKLNSKIKLPPGSGEPEPGFLSPLQEINFTDVQRRAVGIPDEARYYAWFHAIFPNMKAHSFGDDLKFLKNGGFVYFDGSRSRTPLHMCTLELDNAVGQMLFGRPRRLSQAWSDHLSAQGRFQPVTMDAFKDKGATHFCWILHDEELNGEAICPKGGFAYRLGYL